ncbi:unnamed protein product [Heligmosomoides polygyrus]|uniref:Uncharacterized protein n=1 Tax=Heligmosomoides polygyrus TaxID=6339 RepID=A0A183FH12_HELPZ|nr:unnamed protein product [Heligmosomoides polygyrus]
MTPVLSYRERAASLLSMEMLPLRTLGEFIASTENDNEYQLLVGESMKGVRIDVHSMKKEQLAITKLGTSSDAVLDHVLTLLPPMQRQLLAVRRKADAHSRPPLPDGSRIVASHLTKIWTVAERPPFKAVNLNDFMERWRAGPRNREVDQRVGATDFFRRYLQEACEPADAIRVYSCRQSGNAGRNPHLKDLPECKVEALIDGNFLVKNYIVLFSWWIKLGKTDEDREAAFKYRKCCRNAWYPEFRECIGKALGEVRQWTMVANKLVPRQKRRRIFEELGNNSQDSYVGLSQGIGVASVEL